MIIVSGHLTLQPGTRQRFLDASEPAVAAARTTKGCIDFAVSPDLIEPDRVNIFEQWETSEALTAFRADGPGEDLSAMIASYAVREFAVE